MKKREHLPIKNWSQSGRTEYIKKNRELVELVIQRALDELGEDNISKIFGTQDAAINKIIELFVGPLFSLQKAIKNNPQLPTNIELFSQLNFWIKYKTAGRGPTKSILRAGLDIDYKDNYYIDEDVCLEKIASTLELFNKRVAPDIVGYWLKANRKLLNELPNEVNVFLEQYSDIENEVSKSQETRYRVDAAFRYLYVFLGINSKSDIKIPYECKYLIRGKNKPQYVSGDSETHQFKHQVRLDILKIIDEFCMAHKTCDRSDVIKLSLLRGIAKKAVLDVYEINEEKRVEEYRNKLNSLKIPPFMLQETS